MAGLEELLAQQIQLIGSIKRTLTNFKKLGKANMTYAVTRQRLAILRDNFAKCQELDGQITARADDKTRTTHIYFTLNQFVAGEEAFFEASDYMAEILAAVEPETSATSFNVSTPVEASSRPPSLLPRISLPTFDGAFEHWENFRDKFKSMVCNDRTLSNVDRMHYLCTCVKGDASNALNHLAITEANFTIAWNLLVSRYENKRRLIHVHLQTLDSLPSLTAENANDLRTLRDKTHMSIQALKNLGRPIEHWDDIIVFLVAKKLDRSTRKAWELKLGDSREYPSYSELDQFLESRIRALEAISCNRNPTETTTTKGSKSRAVSSHSATTVKLVCPDCRGNHLLYQCDKFMKKSPAQRYNFVKQCKRCINCFSAKHSVKECSSDRTCKQCRNKHHTLLHFPSATTPVDTDLSSCGSPSNNNIEGQVPSHLVSRTTVPDANILLATARVRVHSPQGHFIIARALLDQGSGSTLISEKLANALRLPKRRRSVCIAGIGDARCPVRYTAKITVTPGRCNGPAFSTTALILRTLTNYTPSRVSPKGQWPHLKDLVLADNDLMSSDPIELLIGADLYGLLILDGVRKGADDEPVAQNTELGWILSGPVSSVPASFSPSTHVHHGLTMDQLESEFRRFWEIEEVPPRTFLSPDDQQCEEHFLATHSRRPDGRYVVRLPFKSGTPIALGESRSTALASLVRAEQRLQRTPAQLTEYRAFMSEYESLGHMTKAPPVQDRVSQVYYIPHHAVFRDNSLTTRLRVVFNASCRTSSGKSLNDYLLVGPKLQTELFAVVMQWRQYRYVYAADIAKMYRQILVDPEDWNYQRILWRSDPSQPVEEYCLSTVTYGTASAPYLALRVLQQLAHDEGPGYPLALPVLHRHIYVDDCIFGANDLPLAIQTRDQLIALLQRGGFHLRKWTSNSPELLVNIDPSDHGLACDRDMKHDHSLKILGVSWNPDLDVFRFQVSASQCPGETKRDILSVIAKLFDPLGWATPVVITAKIFVQELWLLKCDWDDTVPSDLRVRWRHYYESLSGLNHIAVPRWTKQGADTVRCELHGFSDASKAAYAAAVYLRVVSIDNSITVSLLMAKSKVAPLKILSIPRLELSAALLLSRLIVAVRRAFPIPGLQCHCWTDSTITLAWLRQPPSHWKTFVANRVSEIQTNLPDTKWHHVPTKENPADCASRGLTGTELPSYELWWKGPAWLHMSSIHWPREQPTIYVDTPEERQCVALCTKPNPEPWALASRFSSWPKLLRVTAYIFRFVRRTRGPPRLASQTNHPSSVNSTPIILSPDDVQSAKVYWLQTIQRESFAYEISQLERGACVPKTSALSSLNPYIDSNGLVRVGGRLRKSILPEATKHPIVLRPHPIVSLIISHHHLRTLHAGPSLTLASLREEFWILRARTTVRSIIYKCVVCTREQAKIPHELMGELPRVRVSRTARPFVHTGVDYAGPILVRNAPGRGYKAHKAYIALFICMTTKAIHLELVQDYGSHAFIAAFHRFVSRRGLPSSMYSDNGTTFQGADRELSKAHQAAIRDQDSVTKFAADGVTWHFLPPAAPHFGGLWEAGVRSVKHHLKRCIGAHTLTFEEMATLLCRIEACLNSRPIGAVSDHLDDYRALTPGHFLVGAPLIAAPEPSVLELKEHRLSRWQLVQRISEGFWQSWSRDYLHTLQQRPKWRSAQRLTTVGQLVLLRNPLTPPSRWELGRIIACHPGEDGITRVVTVKTSRSVYKRPITKLCFLPIDINVDDQRNTATAGGENHNARGTNE